MIRIFTLTLLFLSTYTTSFAQENPNFQVDWSPEIYQVGKIYPGYIIETEGDTLHGFIKALNRCSPGGIGKSNQNTVEFYSNKTDKKPSKKFSAKNLLGYKIADKLYESIKYSGGLFKAPNFNLVVQDGAIRTYEWYATVENYTSVVKQQNESWNDYYARRYETKIIFARNADEPEELSSIALGFRKKMSKLVDNNQELVDKINDKEKGYGILRIYDIVKEYNDWAEKQ